MPDRRPPAGPRLIDTDLTDDFTLYRITLKNSPNFHISFHRGDGLTVGGLRLTHPAPRATPTASTPRSPQHHHHPLLHPHRRRQRRHQGGRRPHHRRERPRQPLLLRPRHVHRQRDQRRSQPLVRGLSLDGPDNGIRIKSNATRGGLGQDVIYDDICIRNSKYPILFDTAYSFPGKGIQLLPVYDGITLRTSASPAEASSSSTASTTPTASASPSRRPAPRQPALYKAQAIHTDLTFGPGPVNPIFTGDDSTVTGKEVGGTLPACAASFIPFPTQ